MTRDCGGFCSLSTQQTGTTFPKIPSLYDSRWSLATKDMGEIWKAEVQQPSLYSDSLCRVLLQLVCTVADLMARLVGLGQQPDPLFRQLPLYLFLNLLQGMGPSTWTVLWQRALAISAGHQCHWGGRQWQTDTGSNCPISSSWIPICSCFLPLDISLPSCQLCWLLVSPGLPHNAEATAPLSTYVKSNLYYPYALSFKSSPSLIKP